MIAIHHECPTNLKRLEGHDDCSMSITMAGELSFGSGNLNYDGTYEKGCPACARYCESVNPETIPCWPPDKQDGL